MEFDKPNKIVGIWEVHLSGFKHPMSNYTLRNLFIWKLPLCIEYL
jgi:hypothetical protein